MRSHTITKITRNDINGAMFVTDGSSPRIVVHPRECRPPAFATSPDDEGWQTAVNRRTRMELRHLECRPVPAGLRGKCFNCFSTWHRAAACTLATRCFHCRELGHRAHDCSVQSTAPPSWMALAAARGVEDTTHLLRLLCTRRIRVIPLL